MLSLATREEVLIFVFEVGEAVRPKGGEYFSQAQIHSRGKPPLPIIGLGLGDQPPVMKRKSVAAFYPICELESALLACNDLAFQLFGL